MSGRCASFMSELLEILDEGRKGWQSWIIAREPYATRSARHRLDGLRQRFSPAVAALSEAFEPRHWNEVPPEDALKLMAHRGKHGIANSGFDLPPKRRAHGQLDRFMARFSDQARLFLNAQMPPQFWQPMTRSTFDLALGVVDGDTIGIFCIEDED